MRFREVGFLLFTIAVMAVIAMASVSQSRSATVKQDQCLSPVSVEKQILKRTPSATIKRLTRQLARSYVNELNSIPPVTRFEIPDVLFVIEQPSAPSSVFAIGFLNGCMIGNLQIRKTIHQKVMQGITGKEI